MINTSNTQRRSCRSSWRYGAFAGLIAAIALEVWRQHTMGKVRGEALEGVWLNAVDMAIRLGFPVNVFMIGLMDFLSPFFAWLRVDPFFLLLLGIVVNWAFLAAVVSRFFRMITRRK